MIEVRDELLTSSWSITDDPVTVVQYRRSFG